MTARRPWPGMTPFWAATAIGVAACTVTEPSATLPVTLNCVRGTHQVNGACAPDTTTPSLRAVTFGAGRFVAVGDGGVIATSPDGKTWTLQQSGTSASFRGVAFGGSQFVAVGSGGIILTSRDAATWTPRLSPTTADLESIAFGNGVFVAAGWSLTIVTSVDGVSWAQGYSGAGVWQDVAFTGSEFVAVNRVGGVIVSADARTWTLSVAGNTAGDTGFCSVAGGPGGAVLALDFSGQVKLSGTASATAFTVEAQLWTTALVESCDLIDLGDTFVATSTDGEVVATPDGTTWAPAVGAGAPALRDLASDGTHIVGVGPNGAILNATCSQGACSGATVTTIDVPQTTAPSGSSSGTSSGSGSGSGSCGATQAMAACPDGTQRCCSTNMVCCHDSANGGAIGCEFAGFCQ